MQLTDIKTPADIKTLTLGQLTTLAGQIRTALLQKLSAHGGHVAPNLGMVEATIAMHYVFNSPKDKIVFDVSHQSYTHKILTGRAQAFTDPRHYDDVTGYTNPLESPHDHFNIGHTSTGVSLAAGLAKARDLKGETGNIIAVVGDGSLSGGEAFEGLDSLQELGTNFICVVNDNQMSIAENHGGLYQNLAILRQTVGTAPCNYFTSLGLDYVYVGRGNDLEALIAAFRKVKDTPRPTVVHIVTDKGHGYAPAEQHKEAFHWHSPFDLATGRTPQAGQHSETYGDVTRRFLLEQMQASPLTVAITAGTPWVMGFDAATRQQAARQFVDVGIAEEHAAALASGLAKGGARPFWGVYSSFVQRAYDQIAQDIAINGNAAVIAVFEGTASGMNDVTHLGFFDIALLSNIPGLLFLAPADCREYLAMARWALEQTLYPVVIRVPDPEVYNLDIPVDADYSDINTYRQVRPGHDIALIGAGNMLRPVLQAADILEKEHGIHPTVINPRFLNAVDSEMLSALESDHRAVLTIEDGILDGGFGQKVASFYADRPMLVRNLGLPKEFVDRFNASELLSANHLTPQGIALQAVQMFK